jgi:hypothetical protein
MEQSFIWLYEALGTMALAIAVMAIVLIVTHYLE